MTLTFKIKNPNPDGALAVTVSGERRELVGSSESTCFETSDTGEASVQVELVRRSDIKQIKNPVGRFFARLLMLLLSTVVFCADNDNGIGIHKFFYTVEPFDVKKTFKVKPTEEVILITYVPSKYDKEGRTFSYPDIVIEKECVVEESVTKSYNAAALMSEFRLYHYPAYILIFALASALTALMATLLIAQIKASAFGGIVAMALCCAVVLALLIAFICLFVSTHKLLGQIDRKLFQLLNVEEGLNKIR